MNLICCNFCGKSQAEARKLIAGPDVFICDSCILICKGILDRELSEDSQKKAIPQASPPIKVGIMKMRITALREIRDRLAIVRELRELKAITAVAAEDMIQELCRLIRKSSPKN